MKIYIVLLTWLTVFASHHGVAPADSHRARRNAAGALHIVTNHAQPIHADVKPDNMGITQKPCPKNRYIPSHIENGVVFQVTAPEDVIYQAKSLRKSLLHPSKVDIFRNTVRLVTLAVLLISAVLEFYPLLQNLYHTVYTYIYL